MVLDKAFLATDKVGRMTEYIVGNPKKGLYIT